MHLMHTGGCLAMNVHCGLTWKRTRGSRYLHWMQRGSLLPCQKNPIFGPPLMGALPLLQKRVFPWREGQPSGSRHPLPHCHTDVLTSSGRHPWVPLWKKYGITPMEESSASCWGNSKTKSGNMGRLFLTVVGSGGGGLLQTVMISEPG